MADLSQIEQILRQADRLLKGHEDAAVKVIDRHVRKALVDLEARLRRLDEQSKDLRRVSDVTKREAQARLLIAQLETALAAFDMGQPGTGVPDAIEKAILKSQRTGVEMADSLLQKYDESSIVRGAVDLEAVAAATANVKDRLSRRGTVFGQKAEDLIVSSLIRGEGPRRRSRQLAEETGILLYEAERIMRTESIRALDSRARDTYARNGIKLIQVLATLDVRVCGWCANRHGNVYQVDECPIPQHPNCRCAAMPVRLDWLENGIINIEDLRNSKATVLARTKDKLRTGASPAEKFDGKDPAKPVWLVPKGGTPTPPKEPKGKSTPSTTGGVVSDSGPDAGPVTIQPDTRRGGFRIPKAG